MWHLCSGASNAREAVQLLQLHFITSCAITASRTSTAVGWKRCLRAVHAWHLHFRKSWGLMVKFWGACLGWSCRSCHFICTTRLERARKTRGQISQGNVVVFASKGWCWPWRVARFNSARSTRSLSNCFTLSFTSFRQASLFPARASQSWPILHFFSLSLSVSLNYT